MWVCVALRVCVLTTITNLSRALSSCSQFQLVTYCALLSRVRSLSAWLSLSVFCYDFPFADAVSLPARSTLPQHTALPLRLLSRWLSFLSLSLSQECALSCACSRAADIRFGLFAAPFALAWAAPRAVSLVRNQWAVLVARFVTFLFLLLLLLFLLCVRVNCFCCTYCKHTQTSYTPPLDHTHTKSRTRTQWRDSHFLTCFIFRNSHLTFILQLSLHFYSSNWQFASIIIDLMGNYDST